MLSIKYFPIITFIVSFLLLCTFTDIYGQQKEEKVRISPKASITQTVGFTDITISYSRPGVKGRKIWGGLVPYDKVWRAGANEATKITFSTDVKVEGKKLSAGSYSFFAIPGKSDWTLIFNKTADQWGAFEYNEAEDAFRFTVKPEKGNFTEWLRYEITRTSDNTATISLLWENLKVPFKVEVKLNK
jgi:hypothetical protein